MTSYNWSDPSQMNALLFQLSRQDADNQRMSNWDQQLAMQTALVQANGQGGGGSSYSGGGSGGGGGGSFDFGGAMSAANNAKELAAQKAMQDAQLRQEMQIAQMQNASDMARLGLDRELGMGNLQIGNQRLALDDLLGKRNQQLQAADQYGARATRQLVAPGGKLNPTLQPIVERSTI